MRSFHQGDVASERWATLRKRFGGPVSHVLSDPECRKFTAPDIEGVIAYRQGLRCLVAIGDPICRPEDADLLAERFRALSAGRGGSTVFACAGRPFMERCVSRGYAAAEIGEELIFDPSAELLTGARGRELRKKVARARRNGVLVAEYHPEKDGPQVAPQLESVRERWLGARRGVQMYITPVLLFDHGLGRRWFYASVDGSAVGVCSLIRLDAMDGWLLEHLMWIPGAPQGITEALITFAFARLAEEGCSRVTFGPAMRSTMGQLARVGRYSAWVVRAAFELAAGFMRVDSLARYRRKFQPVLSQPAHLLFHPARVGVFEVGGLFRAFNLSLKWSAA